LWRLRYAFRALLALHFQYQVCAVLGIRMGDRPESDCLPGYLPLLHPGQDACVPGDEPVVVVDFQGMDDHAKSGRLRAVRRGRLLAAGCA